MFALAHATREGEKRLTAYYSLDLPKSVKRSISLSTARRMLAQSWTKALSVNEPGCFSTPIDNRNRYELLLTVWRHYCPEGLQTAVASAAAGASRKTSILLPAGHKVQTLTDNVPLKKCTTARKFVMRLNYHADETMTTINYYVLVVQAIRDNHKVSCWWVLID